MDIFAVVGLFFGITFILVGQAMEGGNLGQLLQITAAFIVFGGTGGAVILSFPPKVLKKAITLIKDVFIPPAVDMDALIAEIVKLAQKERREGLIVLEKDARTASDSV